MRGSPEDSNGGNWVWLKEGNPGVKGSPVPRWACEKQEESSSLRGARQFPFAHEHEALLSQRPAGPLRSAARRAQENSKQGSQLHTHMSKGDQCICVAVIGGVQVHQGTNCSCLFGICNLRQRVTLIAHSHCKQVELRQVHGIMV